MGHDLPRRDRVHHPPSLELDADGQPHLAFVSASRRLAYHYRTDTGWLSEELDVGSGLTSFTDLEIDSSGHIHIAYVRSTADRYQVYVIRRADGAFGSAELVTSNLNDYYTYYAMTLAGPEERPVIAYRTESADSLGLEEREVELAWPSGGCSGRCPRARSRTERGGRSAGTT